VRSWRQAFENFLIMSKLRRIVMLFGFVPLAPEQLVAGQPFNAQGDVGNTSYVTLPFQTSVIQDVCGSSAGLIPIEEYYSSNS
jgi:hypothetical protein